MQLVVAKPTILFALLLGISLLPVACAGEPGQPAPEMPCAAMFGAGKPASLLSIAPEYGYVVNHSPYVFGLPGTDVGSLARRTQLTGDWGGARSRMVNNGVFVDVYSTTLHQDITSGGLAEVDSLTQSTDVAINLDTGRLGWWPMGVIHLGVMSRYGSDQGDIWAAGAFSPTSTASVYPSPLQSRATCLTEYYWLQAVTSQHLIALGKVNTVFVADQNEFAGNYRYQFQNLAFNINPILSGYFNQTAVLAADIYLANSRFRLYTAIADPNTHACQFPDNAFRDVTFFQEMVYKYDVGNLPGTLRAGWAATSKEQTTLPGVEGTRAFRTPGGPTVGISGAYAFFLNVGQYLGVTDCPDVLRQKRRTGQPYRGWGVFGRLGAGPASKNRVDLFGSVGIGGYGLARCRPEDRFGLGWYIARFSDDMYTGPATPDSEQGVEVFYNFAITPAVQITPSFQYIWNPVFAGLVGQDHAALWGLRLEIAL